MHLNKDFVKIKSLLSNAYFQNETLYVIEIMLKWVLFKYPFKFFGIVLFSMLNTVLELSLPFLFAQFVENFISKNGNPILWIVIYCIVSICVVFVSQIKNEIAFKIAAHTEDTFRSCVLSCILREPLEIYQTKKNNAINIINKINGCWFLIRVVFAGNLSVNILRFIGISIWLLYYSKQFFGIMISSFIILYFINTYIETKNNLLWKKILELRDEGNNILIDVIDHIKIV